MRKALTTLISVCLFQFSPGQLVADFSATATSLDCNNECIDFTDLTTGGTPISWQWSFPGAVPSSSTDQFPLNICYQDDGLFDVTLIVSDGFDSDTITRIAYIFKESVAGAFVSQDTVVPYGFPVILTAGGGSPGTTFSWFPATGLNFSNIASPIATPFSTTTYAVTITDGAVGCSTVLEVTVTVLKADNVFVPLAFSPNSDNYNEYLNIYGNNFKSVLFSVYDRWGTKVFETTNQAHGWDGNYKGERAAAGVYTYTAIITFENGVKQTLAGKTSLVR